MYKIFIKERESVCQETKNHFMHRVYEILETILGLQNKDKIHFTTNSSPEAIFLLRLALPSSSTILLPCGWNDYETGTINLCWKTPNDSGHFSGCAFAEKLLEKYANFNLVMGHTPADKQEDILTIKQINALTKEYKTEIVEWSTNEDIETEMADSRLVIRI